MFAQGFRYIAKPVDVTAPRSPKEFVGFLNSLDGDKLYAKFSDDTIAKIGGSDSGKMPYGTTGVSVDTYITTLSPVITAYSEDQVFLVNFLVTNTGPSTLNANGLGAIPLKTIEGDELDAKDIEPGIYMISYNGTYFELSSQINPYKSINEDGDKLDITPVGDLTIGSSTGKVDIGTTVAGKDLTLVTLGDGSDVIIKTTAAGSKSIVKIGNIAADNAVVIDTGAEVEMTSRLSEINIKTVANAKHVTISAEGVGSNVNLTANKGAVNITSQLASTIKTINDANDLTLETDGAGSNINITPGQGDVKLNPTIGAVTLQTAAGANVNIQLTPTGKLSFFGVAPTLRLTTLIAAAGFVANTSGIADDTATFGGYTIGQIVAALKQYGLLT